MCPFWLVLGVVYLYSGVYFFMSPSVLSFGSPLCPLSSFFVFLSICLFHFHFHLHFLFERSEFLIDSSQKKVCACARVPVCLVHVCNNLGFSVWYYVPHTYVPRYVYVSTCVPGWGTYYVPHMFVNCCVTTFVCTW